MRKFNSILLASAVALTTLAGVAYAENPMVGGAAMYADKNIVENAVNSKDHTTLVAAVKAAGLVETLSGRRPVHRLRADQRSLRRLAGRHRRHAAEAREQGQAHQDPDLPRRRRQGACRPTSPRWSRTTAARTRSRRSAAAS